MNETAFVWINSWRTPAIDALMNAISLSGSALNIIWLLPLVCGLLLLHGPTTERYARVRLLAGMIASFVLAMSVTAALKYGLQIPRPSIVFGSQVVYSLVPEDSRYSFPSGHAVFAMWLAVGLWPRASPLARIGLIAYAITVGVARINLGMHFPVDVLVGYAIGASCAWLGRLLYLHTSKKPALPRPP